MALILSNHFRRNYCHKISPFLSISFLYERNTVFFFFFFFFFLVKSELWWNYALEMLMTLFFLNYVIKWNGMSLFEFQNEKQNYLWYERSSVPALIWWFIVSRSQIFLCLLVILVMQQLILVFFRVWQCYTLYFNLSTGKSLGNLFKNFLKLLDKFSHFSLISILLPLIFQRLIWIYW